MRLGPLLTIGIALTLCGHSLNGTESKRAAAAEGLPVIQRIDPPNWWPNLPPPVLLLYGEHLQDANFRVEGQDVALKKSAMSDNGHWAFLWLDTTNAAAQTLTIIASDAGGSTKAQYRLAQRTPPARRYQGFSARDAMYLIMTDRFADGNTANDSLGGDDGGRNIPRGWHGGDFQGIENHLDYLQQLGVTALWTTPITSNAGMTDSYHGYGTTDMYAVDPHFGSIADYRKLADALHARGMKIVLDMVPNHVGVRIPWVEDPPAPEWFHGTLQQHLHPISPFRYLPDPHAAPLDTANIRKGWFTDSLPDLNQENPLVSQYLIQNAIWWIETAGLDGLRLDTFPYVGRQFWADFHRQLHALYPHLTTVGEVFTPDPTITSYFAGGSEHAGVDTGLDTPFDFPVYFTLRDVFLHNKPMTALEDTLRQDWLYPHPERLVTFLGNHDTTRFLSEPGASIADLKVAFGLLATLRGMPQVYSGDEVAMRGGPDPDNRHDFPGGFPGDAKSAFTARGRTPEQQDVFAWLQGLLQLRSREAALTEGQQQNIFADDTAFAFLRGSDLEAGCTNADSKHLLVIAGKNDTPRHMQLKTDQTALVGCEHYEQLYPSQPASIVYKSNSLEVTLPPDGFVIYRATP
jgi:neopullulanase